jgi:cell division transport system permease protein
MLDSISFFRVIKNAFLNASRNLWLSGAATFVTAVTLIVLSGLLLVLGVIGHTLTEIKNRVDVSVYLKTGAPEVKVLEFKKELEKNTLVESTDYVPADEALNIFRKRHSNDTALIESLQELPENPLSATVRVRAKSLEDYPKLVEDLQKLEGGELISKVNFDDNKLLIERLSRVMTITVTGGVGLLLAFAVLAILVNFNTVALAIYHRREEVEIMRLVGATNWYIRGPFLVEALLYSVLATIITSIAVIPLYTNGLPRLGEAFGFSTDFVGFFTMTNVIILQLLVAMIISSSASLLAIRKYLNT